MTRIKLCGLSRSGDIDAANALLPDFIGFVFAPKSRRYVSPETAAELRARLDPAVRAVGVFVNEPPERVAALLAAGTDFILLDNGAGGTGEAFDRSLLAGFAREYILAGGLNSETVASAVRALRPYAVDVSSGIETGGFKDTEKMRAFVEAVRAVPAEPGEEDGK